jgi:protein-tyrosine phosphatase
VKEIFWIESDKTHPHARIAIVLRPRGDDWLEDEVQRIRETGIQTLVSMLESEEGDSLGLAKERIIAERMGLTFISYPIPDRTTPSDIARFREFVSGLAARAQAGERIGIHCRGSIGRATIATACALMHLGSKPDEALAAIASTRGCVVPDTDEQREWIRRYEVNS